MKCIYRRLVRAGVLCAAAWPMGIHAQQGTYPYKPVVVVVPAGPGSVSETEGRIHLSRLGEILGQQFVFDFFGFYKFLSETFIGSQADPKVFKAFAHRLEGTHQGLGG